MTTPASNLFDCVFCAEILKSPKRCKKCKNVFCHECINDYSNRIKKKNQVLKCPFCKTDVFEIEPDIGLENTIKKMQYKKCPDCEQRIKSSSEHEHDCKKKYYCKFCGIGVDGMKNFINHLKCNDYHKKCVIITIDGLNKNPKKKIDDLDFNSSDIDDKNPDTLIENTLEIHRYYFNLNKKEIPKGLDIKTMKLPEGVKFYKMYNLIYCGKNNQLNCNCCQNHKCEPGNCLCVGCMKLNQELHGLKENYLINKAGRAAKCRDRRFYCYVDFKTTSKIIGNNDCITKYCCRRPYSGCEACKCLTNNAELYLGKNEWELLKASNI